MSETPNPSAGRPHAKRRKKPRKKLHTRLHRVLGLWSSAIVVVISLTGIALNHTEALKLDDRRVTAAPILKRYGMQPEGEPVVFGAGDHVMALWDGECLFDDSLVDTAPQGSDLVAAGMVNSGEFAFVFPAEVIVCDSDGGLVDRLDAASLPEGVIASAGSEGGELVVKLSSGESLRLKEWLEAVPVDGESAMWFSPLQEISTAQRDQLAGALRGDGLPMSRVVLDLHSGRLFGALGVVVYDLAAVCLIVLGITGVMLWLRRR